jgi:hypothetical protein
MADKLHAIECPLTKILLLFRDMNFVCKIGSLDFVHRLYFNKNYYVSEAVSGPGPGLRLAQPGGPTSRVPVLPFF